MELNLRIKNTQIHFVHGHLLTAQNGALEPAGEPVGQGLSHTMGQFATAAN